MIGFDVDWQSVVTLLAVVGCLAGSGVAAWRLFCASVTRNAALAHEGMLLASGVLFAAFLFFHHQAVCTLPHETGRTAYERQAPAAPFAPPTQADLRQDAQQRAEERRARVAREDREQRERERREREQLLESLTSSGPKP